MKVVLRQTLPSVGRAGDIVEVSDAQARNFLIPRRLAQVATPALIDAARQTQTRLNVQTEKNQTLLRTARNQLTNAQLVLRRDASPNGRLFAAVKPAEIIEQLHIQFHVRLEGVTLRPAALKQRGQHQVDVLWPDGQTSTLTVQIEGQS